MDFGRGDAIDFPCAPRKEDWQEMWGYLLLLALGLSSSLQVVRTTATELELEARFEGASPVAAFVALPPSGGAEVLSADPRLEVSLHGPFVLRDLRMALVEARTQDADLRSARFTLRFTPSGPNPKRRHTTFASLLFRPLYEALVVNPEAITGWTYRPGTALIIAHDGLLGPDLDSLALWKTLTGEQAVVVPLSQIGSNPTREEIKAFIENAYSTWEVPPDLVLLVGDESMPFGNLPTWEYCIAGLCDPTDQPYGQVEGDDYFPDILVGRISVDSPGELTVFVQKILAYERNPDLSDPSWLRRAIVVAGRYPHNVRTTRDTKMWTRGLMLEHGYLEVDTFFTNQPQPMPDLTQAINEGVGIINYRGWANARGWHYPQFYVEDIQTLSNGTRLPVMFSVVCGTGDYGSNIDPCFGEAWIRAGVPGNLKGGPAFFGATNVSTHTSWNNAIDAGIFYGLFREGIRTFALAGLRGLIELARNFPDRTAPGDSVEFYFHVYNTLGDPALDVWTEPPQALQVEAPDALAPGPFGFQVWVRLGGTPVSGARVVLYKPDEDLFLFAETNGGGAAAFSGTFSDTGTAYLAVTGPGLLPWVRRYAVSPPAPPVVFESYSLGDSGGDGRANPGETLTLSVVFRNTGGATAGNTTARLRSGSAALTVLDSLATLGDLPPGGTATGTFTLQVAPNALPQEAPLRFWVTSSLGSAGTGFRLPLYAPLLQVTGYRFVDEGGDGRLDPGESAELWLSIRNEGNTATPALTLTLASGNSGVSISDSTASLPPVSPGETAEVADPFALNAAHDLVPGRLLPLSLTATGDGIRQTLYLRTYIGTPGPTDPQGPSRYGYWAYDTGDQGYAEAPEFAWVEIDPHHGGSGTALPLGDDETRVVPLPFPFVYFGREVDMISICSNGWAALDSTDMVSFRNWRIPAALDPPSLLAVYWDDLEPGGGGGVYTYHDAANHRFIVEWSRLRNRRDTLHTAETFQLILYDPSVYPTATGDGEIVFQYLQVQHVDSAHYFGTVGIGNRERTDGLEYAYGLLLPPTSVIPDSGLAIKFTTDPPDGYSVGRREVTSSGGGIKPGIRPLSSRRAVLLILPAGEWGEIAVFDRTGRRVWHRRRRFRPGAQLLPLPGDWPAGIYWVRYRSARHILRTPYLHLPGPVQHRPTGSEG